jgi:hypothetical protein
MVKFRKSWPLLISILAPICQVGFIAVLFWYSDAVVVRFRPGYRFWLELNFVAWNLFVLPAVAAVLSDLSWEQDRDAFAWRHFLHQPLPGSALYSGKLVNHVMLVIGATFLLFMLQPLAGKILQLNEDLQMGAPDTGLFFRFALFSLVSLFPIVTFQTWFSFRFPGPALALGTALVGSWGTVKLIGTTALIQFLPWGLSSHSVTVFERWNLLPWGYCFGAVLLVIVFIFVGAVDFSGHASVKSLERN